jgi:dihydrodipicolinate synthase/N-acetylneuraminate lyase
MSSGSTRITIADLNTPVAFVPIPFRGGRADLRAQAKAVRYLIENNFLDSGVRRAVANGGSSLVHHLSAEELLEVARVTCEAAAGEAWHISGVAATPPRTAEWLVREQMRIPHPPDAFLLMPLTGVYNPEGVYGEIGRLTERLSGDTGARFLLYLRDASLREAYCRLARDREEILGIKIGTSVDDVAPARQALGEAKAVVWGIGDLSTRAIRAGARGHTSGTAIICARLVDEINNAHRRGDYDEAERLEAIVRPLEEIRFMSNRAWNYSAVIELLQIAGFEDVDPGEGGPFNAPPPPQIREKLRAIANDLRAWHSRVAVPLAVTAKS